jgi:hypothetical protein
MSPWRGAARWEGVAAAETERNSIDGAFAAESAPTKAALEVAEVEAAAQFTVARSKRVG